HVYDQPNDSILSACNRLGLTNQPDNHVQVVFIPALMNGNDGFLNMSYDEVLAACDLGVFPSWYEPWGYTPQESAAHSVPTVTTDLSGFGLWARTIEEERGGNTGVTVLSRRQISYDATVTALRSVLLEYATCPQKELDARRCAVRALSWQCSWKEFFPHYVLAFKAALENAGERDAAQDDVHASTGLSRILTGSTSTTPSLHTATAVARLPEGLSRLRELAYNFWWAWHPEAWTLFSMLDPANWKKSGHNPVRTLEEVNTDRLVYLAADTGYLDIYHRVMALFDRYMSEKPNVPGLTLEHPVAYFSTEYGLNECLPIYSGGLGVLSGDHLKSSSDLNLPLVAVGLLYRNGYFQQQIDRDGRQVAVYPENDFSLLPVEQVKTDKGLPLSVTLDLPGRQLQALVWLVRVGRISLYLLDTDSPQNTDDDRRITARLYEADRDLRLRQEILLGIGGVRLLRKLGITPALFHMNEGHSAFLVLERIRENMVEHGMTFAAASEVVRSSCLFTTHTPVDAGNERFSLELMERYFTPTAASVGLSWQEFIKLGRMEEGGRNQFEMTALALKFSLRANGVSRLHGYVSRHMWRQGWKGVPVSEVPIGHVTNGVHMPSYVGGAMRTLLDRHLGSDWACQPPESPIWERIRDLPDSYFWAARQHQKAEMLDTIRKSLPASFAKFNIPRKTQKEIFSRLTPAALVIGFARRFAPYKRATLLFADPERLQRIIGNPDQPVIFIFAGKAHPADTQGIDLIQQVVKYSHDPRFAGRVFFVENYSLAVSRVLAQGCDVWLNTPRRPYEASGTSGQKVPVNGGLNLSISDGWWCEGYADPTARETLDAQRNGAPYCVYDGGESDAYEGSCVDLSGGRNGWTIGPVVDQMLPSDEQNDYADAESLYTLLEESVLPLYFDRDVDDVPHKWLSWGKNSLRTLTAKFSSNRMVRDYLKEYYLPCAKRHALMQAEGFALPRRLSQWKEDVATRFSALKLDHIRIDGMEGDILTCGQPIKVTMRLHPGTMALEELLAQLVIGPGNGTDFTSEPAVVDLKGRRTGDGSYAFTGHYTAESNGLYMYGVRILPVTPGLFSPLESGLVLWG
ncbi:MAG: alpha-glucan family phosphorylase, partial [Bilophila sp.]